MEFRLKEGMLLGAASAATQIEGGDLHHSWNNWYRQGKIKDGSNPANANQHYRLWKEDADLMKEMGISVYRMGVEWARIEPQEGNINRTAIRHYRQEIKYLRQNNIQVLLTLHHFTNPMWFEEKGGFSEVENGRYYLRFVRLIIRELGDLVSEYITINEPNVYALNSWYNGEWPPGEKSFFKTMKVMSVMASCHIRAYELIHEERQKRGFSDTRVSFANHLRVFEPRQVHNLWHKGCAWSTEWLFQKALTIAMCTGRFLPPLQRVCRSKEGEYCDFLAINYYSRSTVSGFADGVRAGVPVNDLGWEIYPQGITACAQMAYDILPRPIYITENGTCDRLDLFRARFIAEHLEQLCNSDLPVERYYHWCFCDNFEWLEGESARFGLVHVNYETQERSVKASGRFYAELIREGGVTSRMAEEYLKGRRNPEIFEEEIV